MRLLVTLAVLSADFHTSCGTRSWHPPFFCGRSRRLTWLSGTLVFVKCMYVPFLECVRLFALSHSLCRAAPTSSANILFLDCFRTYYCCMCSSCASSCCGFGSRGSKEQETRRFRSPTYVDGGVPVCWVPDVFIFMRKMTQILSAGPITHHGMEYRHISTESRL